MHMQEWQTTYIHDRAWKDKLGDGEWDHLFTLVDHRYEKWHQAISFAASGNTESLRSLLESGIIVESLFPLRWEQEISGGLSGPRRYPKAINAYETYLMESTEDPHITLMHLAAKCNQIEVMRLLLAYGATVDCASIPSEYNVHSTPLSDAVLAGHVEAVEFLLAAGAGINYTIKCCNTGTTFREDLFLRVIHQLSGDPSTNSGSSTRDILSCLFQRGLSLDFGRRHSSSLMAMAIRSSRLEVVQILVENGARCHDTLRSFMYGDGGLELLRFIVANGACDGWVSPIFDYRSPELISEKDRVEMFDTVVNKVHGFWEGPEPAHKLVESAQINDFVLVKYLLANGTNINSTDQFGRTALMVACYLHVDVEMIKFLLVEGADLHQKIQSSGRPQGPFGNGLTALHIAACNHHSDTVRLLIESGADVHARTSNGLTPFLAMMLRGPLPWQERPVYGDLEATLTLLFEAGAEMDLRDMNNRTALHIFAQTPRRYLEDPTLPVRVLIELGADPYALDNEGKTPAHYVANANGYDMVPVKDYFLKHTSEHELVIRAITA